MKTSILTLHFLNILSLLSFHLQVGACDSVYVRQLTRAGRVLVVARYSSSYSPKFLVQLLVPNGLL